MGGTAAGTGRLPYATAYAAFAVLRRAFNDHRVTALTAGSLRRQHHAQGTVGDLDIVLVNHEGHPINPTLIENIMTGRSFEKVSGGDKKSTWRFPGDNVYPAFQTDLYYATAEDAQAQRLTWTGSMQFNIVCRARAKARGAKLSQYGLQKKDGTWLRHEDDILSFLDMSDKLDPKERE